MEDPSVADTVPVVLTPTRLKQSLAEAPASVTIITSETLRRYGVRTIVDAMRFVPGMQISQADGNQYQINYHGTNALNPRRMNVMIDGVTMYQPAFSEVKWDSLPVSIDDVERIEVIRGSNSATYGPNSMMAVINIITKHPSDVRGTTAAIDVGSNNNRRFMLRHGGSALDTDYKLTFERFEDGGFDLSSGTPAQPAYDNGIITNHLSLNALTTISSTTTLQTSAALWNADRGYSRTESNQLTDARSNLRAGYLAMELARSYSPSHQVKVKGNIMLNEQKQGWRSSYPRALFLPEMFAMYQANPAYAAAIVRRQRPSGGTAADDALAAAALRAIAALGASATDPVQFDVNQDYRERRAEIEIEDTRVYSPSLRSVFGLGLRYNQGVSETFFNGSASNTVLWGYGNLEYKVTDWLNLNVGGYLEKGRISGSNFAPRLALNAKVDKHQTLRFVASRGDRSPDLHEQKSYWTYTGRNASVAAFEGAKMYQSGISTNELGSEHVDSLEIGYLAMLPDYGLTADVRVFKERMYNLISERLSIGTFYPTNNGKVNLTGAEMQLSAEPSPEWGFFLNYAYVRNDADPLSTEATQVFRHSATAGVTRKFSNGLRVSLDMSHAVNDAPGGNDVGRVTLTALKSVNIGSQKVDLSAQLRKFTPSSVLWPRPGTPTEFRYPNAYQFQIGARISF